jgi:AcrR family transcriptional regulator
MSERTKQQREPLTRERVIHAALRVMDDESLEAVSMRRIAREVGVEAMSLYNHVRDKEDLLDGVVALVMHEFDFPEPDPDPIEYGRELAKRWRRLLRSHPAVIALFAQDHKPFADIESLRPMEESLGALMGMGLTTEEAAKAFQVIGGYIMGYVMMETGRMLTPGHHPDTVGEPLPVVQLPAELLPRTLAALPHMANCDVDEQFEFGLELMLDGLRTRAASTAAP